MRSYEELVKEIYDELDKDGNDTNRKYDKFFINNSDYPDFRLQEPSLWTYWQGRGVRNPKIMVVGQDWGSIEQSRKYYEYIKIHPEARVVCLEQIKKEFSECKDSDFKTDEELVKLMQSLGYGNICERDYPELYFTNLIPGYRNSSKSTGNGSKVAKAITGQVEKDFRNLLEILQPKVVICLGRLVGETVAMWYGCADEIKGEKSFNKFLYKELHENGAKPMKLKKGNEHIADMFVIAHLGNLGIANRRRGMKEEEKKNYPEKDWEAIGNYLNKN